ncbi:MAG: hypothetical protein QF918_15060 [Pirellulaceae bacterium]|jgi:hypothetical protein|nr:hypothetical protein [Pirellulaceae bacterium]MDP6556983.1 hypothetical protein [Pirellulaceae bacterium]MDP6723464.1 hypothetical protein [Pirellulaceae bacterium]
MSGIDQQIGTPRISTSTIDLIAQGRVSNLGDRFQNGGGGLDWMTMFFVVAGLAFAIVLVWMVSCHLRLRESGGYHNHRSLFRELCRAHRLCWPDRRLLIVVARQQGVVVPARLFVEPERFEPERLEGLRKRQRLRAAKLHETLFREETDPTK